MVVLSSGLWGCLESYTQLGRELASAGAIAVALDHEDGTGISATNRTTGQAIEFVEQPPGDYDCLAFNRPFLERRNQELREAVAAILGAAATSAPDGRGAGPALLRVLAGADPQRLVLAGHSFGASALMHSLRRQPEAWGKSCRGVLLLDAWPGALTSDVSGAELEAFGASLPVPYVTLFSEMWATNKYYGACCRRLALAPSPRCLGGAIVPGTSHLWVSDSQWWAPAWLLRLLGVVGPANRHWAQAATARALQAALRALLAPERAPAPGLRAELASFGLEAVTAPVGV